MLLLEACGGGGSETSPAPAASTPSVAGPTTPVVVVEAKPTATEASRFLQQATMGATRASIDALMASGYSAWLKEQFAMSRATSHWDWLTASGYGVPANEGNQAGFDATMWRQLVTEPGQLRQRVGMALLDILVVGIGGLVSSFKQFTMAAYVDALLDNAFGNYRDILNAATFSPAMAMFLTYMGNRKANPTTGAQPDENYARELLQLFTLGTQLLAPDGTPKSTNLAASETFTVADVSGLARVFTGLNWASNVSATTERTRLPLQMNAALHETGASSFLGTTVSGEGMAAIKAALDTIFAHPNLPPFVSRQLIQKLVTSNPSPAYVARVSAVFTDNGAGVRGDMKAVITAILLDADARSAASLASTTTGRLRAPILRLTAWARAFKAGSPSDAWGFGDTSSVTNALGQSPGRSPSVFNFYRPGYTPPATSVAQAGLVAPEFQLTNEQSVIGYVNYMQKVVGKGMGDVTADYADMLAIAADSSALVTEVNLLLAAGQLSTASTSMIKTAVDSVSATASNGPINRVGIAILLTLASPDFLTLR
jgi:uncharacterized protein (DUF1800 family)